MAKARVKSLASPNLNAYGRHDQPYAFIIGKQKADERLVRSHTSNSGATVADLFRFADSEIALLTNQGMMNLTFIHYGLFLLCT